MLIIAESIMAISALKLENRIKQIKSVIWIELRFVESKLVQIIHIGSETRESYKAN